MGKIPNKDQLIDEMLTALGASINYIQNQGGSVFFVKDGSFQGEIQNNYLYEFSTDYFDDIPEDTEIVLQVYGKSYEGKVYSIDSLERKIQISLSEHIGKDINDAKLIVTSGYLLKLLVERLTDVKENKIELSEISIKALFPQYANTNLETVDFSQGSFDKYQQEAINHALGSEVSYIWGPPGTGKTTVLSKVIEYLVSQNISVLLLSHTNVATDRVLKKFIEKTQYDIQAPDNIGSIIRLGERPSEEIAEYIEYLGLKQVIEKKQSPLMREIKLLEENTQVIMAQQIAVINQLTMHREIDEKLTQMDRFKQELSNIEKEFSQNELEYKNVESAIVDLESRIEHFQNAGFIGKLISGTSLKKLVDRKTDYIQARENIEHQKNKLIEDSSQITSQIKTTKEYIRDNQRPTVSAEVLSQEDLKLTALIKHDNEQIAEFRKKLSEIELTVINEAKIVVSTLTNAYVNKTLLSRKYDCVIVDEVSMAPIPALFFASGLAQQKTILVGDFCQLPPIAQYRVSDLDTRSNIEIETEKQLVEKWLIQNIFMFSKTEQAIRENSEVPWLKQLKMQYRMHHLIADAINIITYSQFGNDYQLKSAEVTKKRGSLLIEKDPLPGARIAVINTEKSKTREFRTRSGSYYNLYSALLCLSVAKKAIDSDYKTIGIISPFRPQANLLQKMITDGGLTKIVSAETVHKFQGEERDLIIFDLVNSFPTYLTDDGSDGGNDEKLVNVAFSRAKFKCILVCNVNQVESKHSQSSAIGKLIKWCKDKELPIVDSESLLEDDLFNTQQEWLTKIHNLDSIGDVFNKSETADQKNFYKKFCRDILSAKKEIIIDSPFITKDRSEYLLPFFLHALKKGVRIFIITRLASDQSGAMKQQSLAVMNEYEKIGIVILPFKGFPHRKLAIIDRNILWLGSLNILSQRNSEEIMFRTQGKSTCDQLLSFLRFDKNIGKIDDESKLIRCEYCNKPGAWYWTDVGKFGMWTFCLVGGHKQGKQPKTEEEIKEKQTEIKSKRKQKKEYSVNGKPICPTHNREMILKKGRYGEFWGCPEYPSCKITEKFKR